MSYLNDMEIFEHRLCVKILRMFHSYINGGEIIINGKNDQRFSYSSGDPRIFATLEKYKNKTHCEILGNGGPDI
jgi:hypothetical protein